MPLSSPQSTLARVLVTGGAGFVGSNLVRLLVKEGHEVLNFDNLTYAGNVQSLADVANDPSYQLVVGDICDTAAISNAIEQFKPNWIMHLAAESHVDRSIDVPGQFIQTNIVGTYNLLQSARHYWQALDAHVQEQFRFLHVSTDEVYGSLGSTGLFTESTPYDPHSPYSASKASSDHLARAWHDTYGFPLLITNCSNNYGPYQFPEKLIPVVILKCLRGEPIPVYGKGANIRDWLYVGDHCQALLAVITKGRVGQTYNIGGNNELRNIDLVKLLCGIMDDLKPASHNQNLTTNSHAPRTKDKELATYSDLITFVTDRPGHDLRYAIDASKIQRELGWFPKQEHDSGFRRTVEWYLDNAGWWQDILSGDYQLVRLGVSSLARGN